MKVQKSLLKKTIYALIPNILYTFNCLDKKKDVVLTFDDGPEPEITPLIIETLNKKGVKGVFFFQGNLMEKYPEIVLHAYESGHQIGNHTYSHPRKLHFSNVTCEIIRTEQIIEDICGQRSRIFRPPYGRLTIPLCCYCLWKGIKIILWSLDSRDSLGSKRKEILHDIKAEVSRGDIMLFHNDEKACALAIAEVIDTCLRKGYTPVLLT